MSVPGSIAGGSAVVTNLTTTRGAQRPLGTVARFVSKRRTIEAASASLAAASPGDRRFTRQDAARDLVPDERVALCLRSMIPGAPGVELWRDPKHSAAHYKQLQVCGSVWMCAVCAARITEVRRQELSDAIRAWGGQIVFITLTLQHTAADELVPLLDGLQEAARKMRQGRKWRDLEERYGFEFEARGNMRRRIGTVRALEVTFGDHGFHPHQHILGFLRGGVDVEAFTRELRALWTSAVAKVGRFASPTWGISVEHTDAAIADYVAKMGKEKEWTAAHEMTKAGSKSARGSSFTMNGLLDVYVTGGDGEAGRRWREYALAFKGKKQLVWSDGLRSLLLQEEEEKTDEEIVNAQEEEAVFVGRLNEEAWEIVLGNAARFQLLQVASSDDVEAIRRFLLSLGIEKGVQYGEALPPLDHAE